MRKLFYLILGGVLLSMGFASCDDEPDNPGDFSIRGTLDVVGISSTLGHEYNLVVLRDFDSTIMRYNVIRDTVIGVDGTVNVNTDTTWYSDGVCRYVKLDEVTVPYEADTLTMTILSNAQWNAPTPENNNTQRWYVLQNSTGGGDGYLTVAINRNNSAQERRYMQIQRILTSDSATIYEIPFRQLGKPSN